MAPLAPGFQILLLLIVVPAAVYDVRFRRIPNWIALTGLIAGFALNAFLANRVTAGLIHSAFGFALAFGIYFVFYLMHAMGAGDAKLMAAIGAIVGPADWLGIFLLTGLIGGVFALVLLLSKGRLKKTLWNVAYLLNEMRQFRAPYVGREELDVKSPKAVTLPHGFTISVACLIFVVASIIWR